MTQFRTRDPEFAERVRRGFHSQQFMHLIGATLAHVEAGAVEIHVTPDSRMSQQHGLAHAGIAWSVADSAAGFAAQTLMGPEDGVLTVELKINLLAPVRLGLPLIARGRVEKSGRRLIVGRTDVVQAGPEGEVPVALAIGTFMCMEGMERSG